MIRIAVAKNVDARAVYPPGARKSDKDSIGTSDWRKRPGSPENSRRVRSDYYVVELIYGLQRTYRTDAHLVPYVVPDLTQQPRLSKEGLQWFIQEHGAVPLFTCLFADVDNPEHSLWTDEYFAAFEAHWESNPHLQTAGVYHTRKGWRIVQPLAEPLPLPDAEPHIRAWLDRLTKSGIGVDWACKDWGRHYRLPNVFRDGLPYRTPVFRLERMTPIALPELPPTVLETYRERSRRVVASVDVEWSDKVPLAWKPRCERIGEAVRAIPRDYHALFFALTGTLLERGVPPEIVPEICRAIAVAGQVPEPEKRFSSALDAVKRKLGGGTLPSYRVLTSKWPDVARAVDEVTETGTPSRLRHQCGQPAVDHGTATDAGTALEKAIVNAPEGVSLMMAGCGIGKTRAAERAAVWRAHAPYASAKAKRTRAAAQSRTVFSVPTNKLAVQITDDLRAMGADVRRVFSPLSVFKADGKTRECRIYEAGAALAEGGQSVYREFCIGRNQQPCDFKEECKAYKGFDGPENAHIVVGNHKLLPTLTKEAGVTATLILDEPPPLLETERFPIAELESIAQTLSAFESAYVEAMRPALDVLITYTREAPLDTSVAPSAVFSAEIVEDVRAALKADAGSTAPPIKYSDVIRARASVSYAREIGKASRVLHALYRALTADAAPILRVDEKTDDTRMLVITGPRKDVSDAYRRRGANIVLDATPDIEVITKTIGYPPFEHRFYANDGAPIERTLIYWSAGNRKRLLPAGQVCLRRLVPALRTLIRWALEDPEARLLGIITMKRIAVCLTGTAKDWEKNKRPIEEWEEIRKAIDPVRAMWPGKLLVGHYGAVRGLDDMKDADCLATLGDPWQNLGELREGSSYIGLGQNWNQRLERLARAELEQAHGRIRAPHRARPGRALHMGALLPSGPGWEGGVQFRRLVHGPEPRTPAAAPDALRIWMKEQGLTWAQAGALLGVGHAAIQRYLAGERAIPADIAVKIAAREAVSELVIEEQVSNNQPGYRVTPADTIPDLEADLSADESPLFLDDSERAEIDAWEPQGGDE